ncbi:ComEC/Rec2 family competence protein [Paludibaculum fermentans]|uniref:ComEC/Rec2 family competence protein n=1 Tax=Paludibaculum fermentans TaxID=1473598 RepID=UPI003EB9A837
MPSSDFTHYVKADLARVYDSTETEKKLLATLAWGDKVEVISENAKSVEINIDAATEDADGSFNIVKRSGFICTEPRKVIAPLKNNKVLKFDFVDVQQGDGMVIETPGGKIMLVDGGDNQLFARYLAARFRGSSDDQPKEIDCILVTHGDADHFAGLVEIRKSEKNSNPAKRLFIHPSRIFHNGLVKRPSDREQKDLLGPTVKSGDELLLTGLVDDLVTDVTAEEMNKPFREWRKAIETFRCRGGVQMQRLQRGRDDAFGFLSDGEPESIKVTVLGPIPVRHQGKDALKFLGSPSKVARQDGDGLNLNLKESRGLSASHTINGHSVVLHLQYGDFGFMLAGDLNAEAETVLVRDHNKGEISLKADVLKVPHHGSADFKSAFLKAVAPAISVVSSGDESSRKEFIHPRANLVGALGRFSSLDEPLVFVTEMVAFFEMVGFVSPKEADANKKDSPPARFFAFRRSAFGIVKVRTDGKRILVYTNSGMKKLNEAYAFTRGTDRALKAVSVTQV